MNLFAFYRTLDAKIRKLSRRPDLIKLQYTEVGDPVWSTTSRSIAIVPLRATPLKFAIRFADEQLEEGTFLADVDNLEQFSKRFVVALEGEGD